MDLKFWWQRSLFFYLILGTAVFILVDQKKVSRTILDYLKDSPQYVQDLAAGRSAPDVKKLREALRFYLSLARLFPNPSVYGAIGYCYYQLGRYPQAQLYYEKSIKENTELFGLSYNLAVVYYRTGDYRRAISYFRQANQIPPQKSMIYPKSINPMDQKIKENTTDPSSRLNALMFSYIRSYEFMISGFYHSGQYPQMLETAREAAKVFPGSEDYFFYAAALAAYRLKQFQNAQAFLQQSLRIIEFRINKETFSHRRDGSFYFAKFNNPAQKNALQLRGFVKDRLVPGSEKVDNLVGDKEFLANPGIDVSNEAGQSELFFYPPVIRLKIGSEEKLKIM